MMSHFKKYSQLIICLVKIIVSTNYIYYLIGISEDNDNGYLTLVDHIKI